MRFWDASALVPLLVEERTSDRLSGLYALDSAVAVWWGTLVECSSALARLQREGLEPRRVAQASKRLLALAAAWHEAAPIPVIRDAAIALLRSHPLRAADALQLAAALYVAEGRPASLAFVTLDDRLADAADREGCPILGLDLH